MPGRGAVLGSGGAFELGGGGPGVPARGSTAGAGSGAAASRAAGTASGPGIGSASAAGSAPAAGGATAAGGAPATGAAAGRAAGTGGATTAGGATAGTAPAPPPTEHAWAPDRALAVHRLAARAAHRGARWPRVAAAVTAVRGVSGEDRAGFAARFRLDVPALDALERGLVPARDVPPFLRHQGAFVDWVWVAAG